VTRLSHEVALKLGATWDYDDFIPHITIAYNVTLEALEGKVFRLPEFDLRFGPEIVRSADPNWTPRVMRENGNL